MPFWNMRSVSLILYSGLPRGTLHSRLKNSGFSSIATEMAVAVGTPSSPAAGLLSIETQSAPGVPTMYEILLVTVALTLPPGASAQNSGGSTKKEAHSSLTVTVRVMPAPVKVTVHERSCPEAFLSTSK